jgi:hypothetical protein
LGKRRTHPSYLSSDEAFRERMRTEEMVRSIVDIGHTESSVKIKRVTSLARSSGLTRVGETTRFIVDFDEEEKRVLVYGKDIPYGSHFKLRFNIRQTVAVILMLQQAMGMMWKKQVRRIGEKAGFVVDYDGSLVMLYGKEIQAECQFKLAFDVCETMTMIYLLKKAKNFF